MLKKISKRECPLCKECNMLFISHVTHKLPENASPLKGTFDIVSCESCGFAFSDALISEDEMKTHYCEHSNCHDVTLTLGSGFSPLDKKRLSGLAKRVEANTVNKESVIVDIGCGSGGLLLELKGLGFKNLIGCDISNACVSYIRSLGFEGFQYFLGSQFEHNVQADIIILSHVLEHLENPLEAISALHGVLKNDGLLYVEVPDAEHFRDYCACLLYDFSIEHINYFSSKTLSSLLKTAGYSPICEGSGTFELSNGMSPMIFAFAKKSHTPGIYSGEKDNELSRFIFDYAIKSNVYLDGLLYNFLEMSRNQQVILWGAGVVLNKLLAMDKIKFEDISCIVDSHSALQGLSIAGVAMISPQLLLSENKKYGDLPIIVTGIRAEQSIVNAAQKLGITNELYSLSGCRLN